MRFEDVSVKRLDGGAWYAAQDVALYFGVRPDKVFKALKLYPECKRMVTVGSYYRKRRLCYISALALRLLNIRFGMVPQREFCGKLADVAQQ